MSTMRLRYTSVKLMPKPKPGRMLRCFRNIAVALSKIL
jgi:hypothetical protein